MVLGERLGGSLADKLAARQARIGIVGLGYAGLPMAIEIAQAGFPVVGVDVEPKTVAAVNAGHSPVSDVSDDALRPLVAEGLIEATVDYSVLAGAHAVVICVPTPLAERKRPDLSYVEAATRGIGQHLHRQMLVILQSTCSPGTTRKLMLPILAESGLQVGSDFYLAFAPERIDPGNPTYGVRNTPKLVGGITSACTEVAAQFYRHFIDVVEPVDSPEVAELAKLVENTFRFLNISFANELALLCDRMDVSVWEVIRAASTKPFAFMPHYPGPGVGGHCIPVVPFYLQAAAEELGLEASLIEQAGKVNDAMPAFVVDKAERQLVQRGVDPDGAKYLLLGVTYKPDVRDLRESPSLAVLQALQDRGRDVRYHDPLVDRVLVSGQTLRSVDLTAEELQHADCVLLLTGHSSLDHGLLLANARLLLDTRNILAGRDGDNLVTL